MERNLSYSGDDIKRVRAKLTWAQLELDVYKGDGVHLIIAGDTESVEELRVEQHGDDLSFAQPQLAYAKELLPRHRWLQIVLSVPKTWRGDMDIDTISGTISAHSFAGTDVSLTCVSGSMSVRDVEANLLFLHSVSGAIAGSNLRANRGNLRSVSGAIHLQNACFGATKAFTVSGDVSLELLSGSRTLDMQSVSGAMSVLTEGPARAALHSLSGRFLLDDDVLPATTGGLEISASSVSGSLAVKRKETP